MGKLSVVLATYNEEENLSRCLGSVKSIADEIVIVDGTSKDKTVEIAKKFDAKITVRENPPNFHINKQIAIDKAKYDWILQLDADEVVSNELRDEISRIIDKDSTKDGYWIARKNYFLGRYLMKGGQYPDYTVRLYKKGKGKLPQRDVHEQAIIEGEIGYLKNALLHYPYKNFDIYLKKWMKYNRLLASQIRGEMRGKNIAYRIFFALSYLVARPGHWVITTYFRHKGFMDSWQGLVFSFMSGLRFPLAYILYLKGDFKEF